MKNFALNQKRFIKGVLLFMMIIFAVSAKAQSGTRYVCTKSIYGDGTIGKPDAWADKVKYLDFRGSNRFIIHCNWGDAVFGLRYNNNGQLIYEQMVGNQFCLPNNPDTQYVFSSNRNLLNVIHYTSNGERSRTDVYKQQTQANIGRMYE